MKKIKILLFILILILLTSCGAYENDEGMEGVPYDLYGEIVVEGVEYKIYIPTESEDAIYYVYEEGHDYTDKSSWIINYIYESDYQTDNDTLSMDVVNSLYDVLSEKELELEAYLGYEVSLDKPNLKEEREVMIDNSMEETISYVVFEKYLSIRLRVSNSSEYYNVGVPLETIFLKRTEETVYDPIKDEMILWEDFLATPKLYQR